MQHQLIFFFSFSLWLFWRVFSTPNLFWCCQDFFFFFFFALKAVSCKCTLRRAGWPEMFFQILHLTFGNSALWSNSEVKILHFIVFIAFLLLNFLAQKCQNSAPVQNSALSGHPGSTLRLSRQDRSVFPQPQLCSVVAFALHGSFLFLIYFEKMDTNLIDLLYRSRKAWGVELWYVHLPQILILER